MLSYDSSGTSTRLFNSQDSSNIYYLVGCAALYSKRPRVVVIGESSESVTAFNATKNHGRVLWIDECTSEWRTQRMNISSLQSAFLPSLFRPTWTCRILTLWPPTMHFLSPSVERSSSIVFGFQLPSRPTSITPASMTALRNDAREDQSYYKWLIGT